GRGAAAARAEARHAAVGAAGARQAARARQQGVLQPLPLPQKKHADVTHPAQQLFQQGSAVSPSSRQPQRHMWSRPDMAKQYGGLSLVECMQLFLPPGLRDTLVPSDVSPEHAPAAVATAAERGPAAVAEGAAQQSMASVAAHQLAHIFLPNSHATDSRTVDSNPAHLVDRGMKRLRNDDDSGFSTGAGAAHNGTCEGLSARQLPDIGAVDASAVRSLLLRAADSQTFSQQCESSSKAAQSYQSLRGPSFPSSAHCSSIGTPTSGSLPALDWPLSFSTSLSSSLASSLAPSISPTLATTSRSYLAETLPSATQWRSTTRTPFTFGLTQSSRVLHSAPPNTLPPSVRSTVPPPNTPPIGYFTAPPHNPLASPPSSMPSRSSNCLSAAPFTPTSLITPSTLLTPSDPSTVISPGPPHSIPSFPSLSALQSALHNPPPKAPATLSDLSQHYASQHHFSQRYPSRSASPSNAASSASVDCSPPSSQTSSQAFTQHDFQPSSQPSSKAASHLSSHLTVVPIPGVESLAHTRPHKMPRTSRGVLPPAALEFARSFFSGLPGRDDPQRCESSDGHQMLERTCAGGRGAAAARAEARHAAVGAAGARQAARARQQGVLQPLPLPQKKHADVTLPVQQQSQQGQAVSPSAGQPQRNMWSRPDMAKQYGGLSLVECMQLFLPPGLLHTPTPSDVSPEQTPEFNPPPAAVTTAAGRGHAVAAAAGAAATAPQQSTTAASLTAHQLARILFPNSHATDSHPMDRGLKRLRNDDTGVSTGAAHTAGMREGLSARQREDIEAIDASACSSTPTLGSLPALDWPLSFATSLSPSITPSFASSISPSCSPSLAHSLLPIHVTTSRPYLARPLSSASQWCSTSLSITPFTFGLTQSSRVLHPALPNTPLPSSTVPPPTTPPASPPTAPLITSNNPLTAPPSSIPSPSSHCQSAAPFTPTSPETAAAPLVPSAPSTVINRGPPHSLPTFPSLFALQSALHTPPVKAPPTLSDPSHQKPSQHNPSQNHLSQRYPSRSASPSNAASSASVDCSPPSSQTSSQPSFQHVFQCTAGAVESQQLQAMRLHKMPRTSHGVLPLAALEFARSFFSGLPGRDDHQGGESSDGQKTLEPACTSARQDSRFSGGNAETQYGCVGGGAATELPPEIVSAAAAAPGVSAATAVTGTPDVDSPAAAALAAAAEGIRQGDVSIWKDFIELEGEAEEVVCSVEKRTGLTVGSFCELEELFEETGTLM
ncbi:unnamed protein product, partial [Closterium sp. Naga37s-1]